MYLPLISLQVITACAVLHNICLYADDILDPVPDDEEDDDDDEEEEEDDDDEEEEEEDKSHG